MFALTLTLSLVAHAGPTFIDDDFGKALKQAKAQKKLLFVDAWAPWCHSCVAMKEQVFSRDSFKVFEKDVVFASIDTEKTKNAPFLEKYPVSVWPTLVFIDPVKEAVVLKWLGSADESQMQGLLAAARSGTGATREADDAMSAGTFEVAAAKYQQAVASGDVATRTILSMVSAMNLAKDNEACARTVIEQLPVFTAAADRVAALSWGLSCALEAPAGKNRTATIDVLVRESTKALTLEGVLPDDTSGLYESLVAEREDAKDAEGAKAVAAQWLTFLEGAAAKTKSPAERAVFDPHRVNAAIASGQAAKMVAPLQQSEKDLPRDYNPSARLALIYRELGQLPEASSAIERALGKCTEGPRRLRLFDIKASVLEKKGDVAGQKATAAEAVKYAKKLPKSQISEKRIAALEAQLAKLP